MAARFARMPFSPGLFDVAQDIGGELPLALIEQWLESDQTHDDALELLRPHRVVGTNVVSDSAGLARVTQAHGLLEILAIIQQPKELVYSVGTSIGGTCVGVWATDNTQMFYPERITADAVVAAMLTIQDAVRRSCRLHIGLGAHFGEFYSIAGGLYGAQSEAIEAFAETALAGDDVVISQAVRERLAASSGFALTARDAAWSSLGGVYTVSDGPRLADLPDRGGHYPIPYTEEFYRELVALGRNLGDHALAQALTRKHTHDKVVVFVERESQLADSPEIALLGNFAATAMVKDTGRRHLGRDRDGEIKVVGCIGIYAFDDPARALEFADAFRRELSGDGIFCRIGIDAGPVLIFALAGGSRDIAGDPVNVAARLAQDRGSWGKIYLSDRVYEHVDVRGFQPVTCTVSGVDLHAFEG